MLYFSLCRVVNSGVMVSSRVYYLLVLMVVSVVYFLLVVTRSHCLLRNL